MKLQQLSLFLENRTGQLREPCDVLAKAGINLLTVSLADTEKFGILRFIVKDPAAAKTALEAAGLVVRVTEVVAVQVQNRPGALAAVLGEIEKAGLGVEYMYDLGAAWTDDKSALVLRFEEPDKAIAALTSAGITVLKGEDLLRLP